jgi:glycerol-3-phosphate cytidylyltransferase-like family protein
MGKVVLTTGVFDCGMHIGHFMLLWKCRELAGPDGKVVVGVNDADSAESYKRKPIFNTTFRGSCVEKIPFVNSVFYISKEEDIEKAMTFHQVDYYVKGNEWIGKEITGSKFCSVVFINPTICHYLSDDMRNFEPLKVSTTTIIEKIKFCSYTKL